MSLREFRGILETGNASEIADALQALHGRFPKDDDDLLLFLPMLWKEDVNAYPEINWDALRQDLVRLELSSLLLQAWGNRAVPLEDPKSIVDYAWMKLDPPVRLSDPGSIIDYLWIKLDPNRDRVKLHALLALSHVESDSIVQAFADIAAKENSQFQLAVRVLARSCGKKARASIATLAKTLRRAENREYLESVIAENDVLTAKLGTPFCARVCHTCDLPAQ